MVQISHSFDLFVLSISIPLEISILSYSNIFILHANIHQGKVMNNIYHLFVLQILLLWLL